MTDQALDRQGGGEERVLVWTLPEIAEIVGVDYRTLHNWVQRGLLTPSVREANGSGRAALCDDDDLLTATLLAAARPLLTLDGLAVLVGVDHA